MSSGMHLLLYKTACYRTSVPQRTPAERANFDSELPIIPQKEIAYSDDNDSLQRDCPNQEREGR